MNNRVNNRAYKGILAEQLAEKWLRKHSSLRLVERNYRCRMGELDLIMEDEHCLVFVEVRFRSNLAFGGPLASVTPTKQKRLIQAAQDFLVHHPRYTDCHCRFDVIGLTGSLRQPTYEWVQGAFDKN